MSQKPNNMKHISNYELFLEESNPNTPQGYLNSLVSKQPKMNNKPKATPKPNRTQQTNQQQPQQQQNPTEEIDSILVNAEQQREEILKTQDAIQATSNLGDKRSQAFAQEQTKNLKQKIQTFDDQVKEVDKLNKNLKYSANKPDRFRSQIQKSREQTKL